ncbi:MAG: hypothetical protein JXB26_09730 [Candidatus Aminicenantes bacterium]|nr:hypothetical protein [Candidatus Aminicenantes bacterium]
MKDREKKSLVKTGEKISRREALKKVGLFSTAAASLFIFTQWNGCWYDDWYNYSDWYDYGDWANWWNNPTP